MKNKLLKQRRGRKIGFLEAVYMYGADPNEIYPPGARGREILGNFLEFICTKIFRMK